MSITDQAEDNLEQQGSQESIIEDTSIVRTRRRKSRVHSHFVFGATRVMCNHCGQDFKKPKNGSTSALITHLRRCSPQHASGPSAQVEPFTDQTLREYLTQMFLKHNLPFALMDAADFHTLIQRLDPRIRLTGRGTLMRDIHDMFMRGKALVKKAIADSQSQVSLAVDCWTSPNNLPFLAIVGSWIDQNFTPHTVLLDFRYLEGAHTGNALAEEVYSTMQDYCITDKVLAIAADNASNVDAMIRHIEHLTGGMFDASQGRIHCFAHILHLSVTHCTGALKDNRGFEIVAKLRCVVKSIRSSPQRLQRFSAQCALVQCPDLAPIIDVSTRWNSTYDMIERALTLQLALQTFLLADDVLRGVELRESDWDYLREVHTLLSPFKRALSIASQESMPTFSSTIPLFRFVSDSLTDFRDKTRHVPLRNVADVALQHLMKYFPAENFSAVLSVILDVRFGRGFFSSCDYYSRTIDLLKSVWTSSYNQLPTEPNITTQSSDLDDVYRYFSNILQQHQGPTEVDRFIAEGSIGLQADIYAWWRAYRHKYPSLVHMARDYLAIPATSASAERVFSAGRDLLSYRRASMCEETITECMCVDSWISHGLM